MTCFDFIYAKCFEFNFTRSPINVFFLLVGWQWEPSDRPTFKTIRMSLENVFQDASALSGKKGCGILADKKFAERCWTR